MLALHTATNGQYGFHRDELATIDDARFLSWGYVVYPPVTPFLARLALTLFGPSLSGLRFFAALAPATAIGADRLDGPRVRRQTSGQLVAAWAAAISGPAVSSGTLFQYVSFDYLWWVLAAYAMIRLLNSEDQRWWLVLGAAVGLGMMTKYTMIRCGPRVVSYCSRILRMPRGNPSPKLAITVDPDIHKNILAAAARDGVSVSAWMTAAAREALQRRAGLAAVALWEKQYGRLTSEEMNEARRSVRAQLRTSRTVRRPA